MARLASLDDLLIHGLQDLYHSESQILRALPSMVGAAGDLDLKRTLEDHRQQTEGQVRRLEQAFMLLGVTAKARKSTGMDGALEEAEQVIELEAEPALMDIALIGAAQKVEHYEIAAYGSACSFAEILGYDQVHELLGQNLDEEEITDQKLTALAEQIITRAANGLALEPLERQA
jgi:ferritin-like metal-binding protein YciE